MRLRNAVLAAVSAVALVLAVPMSANAAQGDFRYKYGFGHTSGLFNPPSGPCIDIPEATEEEPAFAPENLTRSTATVFLDFDCEGEHYVVNPGKKFSDRLKLRSVVFS
ncbi:hypothetical protein [Kitasatospora sp. SUK 42]|uniref:hypothetical protein n=1 Tax=Kitasatospora sp. SUK 42 TaxID=1588882 RepID=UPI0018CB3B41|nr:hypothetical protein [Kitasatospora sp. SUK 42]MBV2155274.1 hypothetical protein [Kitasatospora sp. SUK 42]